MDNIFRLHGTPKVIISDRDPRFTSRFWTQFFQILGTDFRLSTAFHPQTDGQSEVTIRVLENFLRPYVELHLHVWSKRLSIVEFAANNAINVSTGYTPFFLNSGENPTLSKHLVISPGSTSNQAVKEAISRMKEALSDAKNNLDKVQEQMKRRVDKTRRTEEWAVGDRVFLSTQNLRMFAPHLLSKLKRRWVGLMRGLVDCWTVWMTTFMLYVLCVCPLDVGIVLSVFAPCFAYPM